MMPESKTSIVSLTTPGEKASSIQDPEFEPDDSRLLRKIDLRLLSWIGFLYALELIDRYPLVGTAS